MSVVCIYSLVLLIVFVSYSENASTATTKPISNSHETFTHKPVNADIDLNDFVQSPNSPLLYYHSVPLPAPFQQRANETDGKVKRSDLKPEKSLRGPITFVYVKKDDEVAEEANDKYDNNENLEAQESDLIQDGQRSGNRENKDVVKDGQVLEDVNEKYDYTKKYEAKHEQRPNSRENKHIVKDDHVPVHDNDKYNNENYEVRQSDLVKHGQKSHNREDKREGSNQGVNKFNDEQENSHRDFANYDKEHIEDFFNHGIHKEGYGRIEKNDGNGNDRPFNTGDNHEQSSSYNNKRLNGNVYKVANNPDEIVTRTSDNSNLEQIKTDNEEEDNNQKYNAGDSYRQRQNYSSEHSGENTPIHKYSKNQKDEIRNNDDGQEEIKTVTPKEINDNYKNSEESVYHQKYNSELNQNKNNPQNTGQLNKNIYNYLNNHKDDDTITNRDKQKETKIVNLEGINGEYGKFINGDLVQKYKYSQDRDEDHHRQPSSNQNSRFDNERFRDYLIEKQKNVNLDNDYEKDARTIDDKYTLQYRRKSDEQQINSDNIGHSYENLQKKNIFPNRAREEELKTENQERRNSEFGNFASKRPKYNFDYNRRENSDNNEDSIRRNNYKYLKDHEEKKFTRDNNPNQDETKIINQEEIRNSNNENVNSNRNYDERSQDYKSQSTDKLNYHRQDPSVTGYEEETKTKNDYEDQEQLKEYNDHDYTNEGRDTNDNRGEYTHNHEGKTVEKNAEQAHKSGDSGKGQVENAKFEKGGGKKYDSKHESTYGSDDDKGYKGHHEDEKSEKGHHNKEQHNGEYNDEAGQKKTHHHNDDYFGGKKYEENGKKGAKFDESGNHEKGHNTKGEHNIHKKEEYEKNQEFFDEYHEDGDSVKHGGFHSEHDHHKGGSEKGNHVDTGLQEGKYEKKGEHEKGSSYKENKGHKSDKEHDEHHDHQEAYGKKDGKHSGKKWNYQKKER